MNGKLKVSLKDLAERLGVSIATVSRALNDSHEVSAEMRTRVKALAKELNYRPNPFARILRNDTPHVIGVVVPDLVSHYFSSLLNGIDDYAQEKGFMVVSTNSQEDCENEKRLIENLLNMHVGGILACLAQDSGEYQHFENVCRLGIPLVFFTRTCLHDTCSSVVSDSSGAAQEATQHLIENGCRRIAFLGGPSHLDLVKLRKHGYLEALKENRIPIDRSLVLFERIDYDAMYKRYVELLKREDRPDAVLAFNDIATYAAFEAIRSCGLRIPEDVAIVGFTNSDTSIHVSPKLSVVLDHAYEQGRIACEMLIKKMSGEDSVKQVVVPMELKVRESSVRK